MELEYKTGFKKIAMQYKSSSKFDTENRLVIFTVELMQGRPRKRHGKYK